MSASVLRTCLLCAALGSTTAFAQGKPDASVATPPPSAIKDKPAPAAPASAPTVEKPAPEFTSFMKDLLGPWSCASTFLPGAFGPGSPEVKATSKMKFIKEPILEGFFYRLEYTVPKSKEVPMKMAGLLYIGFDNAARQLVTANVDNMGGSSHGTGSIADTALTWTGEGFMNGKKVKMRDTLTKSGPRQLTHVFEVDMGMGLQKIGENLCTK
jgi:hypothetical protein